MLTITGRGGCSQRTTVGPNEPQTDSATVWSVARHSASASCVATSIGSIVDRHDRLNSSAVGPVEYRPVSGSCAAKPARTRLAR